jgi:methylthioribose-1-phosphate isomerase
MKVNGQHYRTIWVADEGVVEVIDQRLLPHRFEAVQLHSLEDAALAIEEMAVRGAPLIGATAAFGVALHMRDDTSDAAVQGAYDRLLVTRPTAVNLRWALDDMRRTLLSLDLDQRLDGAYQRSAAICNEDAMINHAIGSHGLDILKYLWKLKNRRQPGSRYLNVLTHCNAGWLACVDWGTALAPVYLAHDEGLPVHVWVDETRPRNQGASITCWELGQHGVPHTLIVDNAGGHLMQHGQVDAVIVGTDRTSARGDVCNKIGTYLKALSAQDNNVPFYVALPSSTIDWTLTDGISDIPIEERDPDEVLLMFGAGPDGREIEIRLAPDGTRASNYAFDVTPARLVTGGLITERGVCEASEAGLLSLFPEREEKAA